MHPSGLVAILGMHLPPPPPPLWAPQEAASLEAGRFLALMLFGSVVEVLRLRLRLRLDAWPMARCLAASR